MSAESVNFSTSLFRKTRSLKLPTSVPLMKWKKNSDNFSVKDIDSKPLLLRKGQIGDWRNYFSAELSKKFDEILVSKLEGSGLSFDFGISNSWRFSGCLHGGKKFLSLGGSASRTHVLCIQLTGKRRGAMWGIRNPKTTLKIIYNHVQNSG